MIHEEFPNERELRKKKTSTIRAMNMFMITSLVTISMVLCVVANKFKKKGITSVITITIISTDRNKRRSPNIRKI